MWVVDLTYAFGTTNTDEALDHIKSNFNGVFSTEEKARLFLKKNKGNFNTSKLYSESKVKIYYIKERDNDLIEIMKEHWPEECL